MSTANDRLLLRLTLVAVLVVVYFLEFPQDLVALISPLERVLQISQVISPWLYGLAAVVIVCWTVHRIGSKRAEPAPRNEVPPT
jgi:hypothetical protein